jgi:hypothetical protein
MAAIRGSFIAVALCLASASAWAGTPAMASWSLASPKGEARASFAPGAGGLATVVVEQRTQKGWTLAWRRALRPDFTASSALLADDGRLLIFADAAAGRGAAIVVHDARGRLVRELDLGLFLPPAYVQSLPRDESGVHWRRDATLAVAQDRAEFSVAVPGSAAGATGPALHFSIDFRDGRVRTAQIREYLVAADRARTLVAGTAASPPAPRLSGNGVAAGVSASSASMSR